MVRIATILCSAISLSAVCGSAQNTISLASNLSRAGKPAPGACQEQAATLARNLSAFPRPDQWRWIILCDDAGWRHFLLQRDAYPTGRGNDESIYASTDLTAHLTYLRGTTLLRPDNAHAKPEHVIAHELAHIALNTPDEERSEQQALTWLKQREAASGPAAGGR